MADPDVVNHRLDAGEAVTFARSRVKQAAIMVGGVLLVAGSVLLITTADDWGLWLVGWVGAVFFSVAVVATAWITVTPAKAALALEAESVCTGQGFFYMRADWDQIADAYVARLQAGPRTTSIAVIELHPGEKPVTTSRTGRPRWTPPDLRGSYRRPDGTSPEGFLVQIPRVVSGLLQSEAADLVAQVAHRRVTAP